MSAVGMAAREISRQVRAGERSASDVAGEALERIENLDSRIGAFLKVDAEGAIRAAREVDRKVAAGVDPGRLAGVPIAIKDNLSTAGLTTTAGSRILERYVPPYDAHVVSRIRAEGGIVVGKTNLDEFGMGSSTENSALGRTVNPRDPRRVPGGSSGGSAAAVASGMVPLALGSDTGGSIRQPAALCGVVGVKPTYGRVSRHGLIAFASSLDTVGPLARSVEDAALALSVLAGRDPMDSTTAEIPVPDYAASLDSGISGLSIGVAAEYLDPATPPEILDAIREARSVLERLGARVVEVSLPHTRFAIPTYYIVANAEASSNLARYDGVHFGSRSPGARTLQELVTRSRTEGFGPEVKRRILLGTFALSSDYADRYYLKALAVRARIAQDFDRVFREVDLVVAPTSPVLAFELGARVTDPLQMYLCDVLTAPASLAGIPAISIPCGAGAGGLPIGLQIMADRFREHTLLAAASAYERATREARGEAPA